MIAVAVTFEIKPEKMKEFMRLMIINAFTSKTVEKGCYQFDVCTGGDHDNHVFLYELYEDASAFDLHLTSDHFKAFDAAVGDMVLGKTQHVFDEVNQ